MEKYEFATTDDAKISVKLGDYYNQVHAKHIDAYGQLGADNIVENIVETYRQIQMQMNANNKNNNVFNSFELPTPLLTYVLHINE